VLHEQTSLHTYAWANMSSTSIDRATPLAIPNGQRSVASGC